MQPTLLILAAGMGSRFGGMKQIEGVGPAGEILLEYSLYDAVRAGFGKVVFVIRHDLEAAFMEKVGQGLDKKIPFELVFQENDSPIEGLDHFPAREKPWGTGHAILVAQAAIQEPFAVINADDYYGSDGFQSMARFLSTECGPNHYGMIGYVLGNTLSENGAVSRGVCAVNEECRLSSVTERSNIHRDELGQISFDQDGQSFLLEESTYVSMNFWGLYPNVFAHLHRQFLDFVEANAHQPKAEFYIPTAINTMMQQGELEVSLLPSQDRWYGVTYREDKPTVEQAFKELVEAGRYPSPLW